MARAGRVAMLALWLVGCAASTQDIQVASLPMNGFGAGRFPGYAWAPGVATLSDPAGIWTAPTFDVEQVLRDSIGRELAQRGMRFATGQPDALVRYRIAVVIREVPLRASPGAEPAALDVSTAELVVEIFDARTGAPLWLGRANAAASAEGRPSDEVRARIDHAVKKMFEAMPR